MVGNCHTASRASLEYLKSLKIGKNYRYVFCKKKPFEPEDIINAEVLAYFPAKMLEVVDIYDSLTFMGGSRNENPSEVVMFMRENFIEDKIKIDPIIFNLFVQFLSEVKGIELPSKD